MERISFLSQVLNEGLKSHFLKVKTVFWIIAYLISLITLFALLFLWTKVLPFDTVWWNDKGTFYVNFIPVLLFLENLPLQMLLVSHYHKIKDFNQFGFDNTQILKFQVDNKVLKYLLYAFTVGVFSLYFISIIYDDQFTVSNLLALFIVMNSSMLLAFIGARLMVVRNNILEFEENNHIVSHA